MSAVNIITEPDAIHMFCDGAHYFGDGTLGAVSSKGHLLPHLRAAVSVRGPALFLDRLGPEIGRRFESFDEMVDGIVDLARDVSEREADTLARCQIGADFDLFVAGFSVARNRPEAYIVASHGTNVEPWVLHELGPIAIAPYDAELGAKLAAMEPTTDVLSAGIAIMEAQRGVHGQNAGHGPAMAGVGGHCQWIRITRDSIQTAIVRRWDDVVGEKLGSDWPKAAKPISKRQLTLERAILLLKGRGIDMKLNLDLLRDLLLHVESNAQKARARMTDINLDGWSQEDIKYHVLMAMDGGLLIAKLEDTIDSDDEDNNDFEYSIERLTKDGHEFIGIVKEGKHWKFFKEQSKSLGITTVKAITELSVAYLKQEVMKHAGLAPAP